MPLICTVYNGCAPDGTGMFCLREVWCVAGVVCSGPGASTPNFKDMSQGSEPSARSVVFFYFTSCGERYKDTSARKRSA